MNVEKIENTTFEPTLEQMEGLMCGNEEFEDYDIPRELKHSSKVGYLINGWLLTREAEFGGSGKGDDFWVVVKASKEDKVSYWKFYGWYASHDGGYLENVKEVKPVEKTVIVWEGEEEE